MVIFTNSWKIWLAAAAFSLALFAIIYFAVIQPANDQADEAIDRGFQQADQALEQSQQALDESQTGSGSGSGSSSGGEGTANEQIDEAQLLAQCLSEAGADVDAIQDCQAEFGP